MKSCTTPTGWVKRFHAGSSWENALGPSEEGDQNVVTLSTLHAAKGLEWPHVVLAEFAKKSAESKAAAVASQHSG